MEKTVVTTVRLPESLKRAIDSRAGEQGCSVSAVINRALQQAARRWAK